MAITLTAARVNKGLKQSEAAKALGINVKTLQNYELGRTFPDVQRLKKIEKLYGVEYKDLNFFTE